MINTPQTDSAGGNQPPANPPVVASSAVPEPEPTSFQKSQKAAHKFWDQFRTPEERSAYMKERFRRARENSLKKARQKNLRKYRLPNRKPKVVPYVDEIKIVTGETTLQHSQAASNFIRLRALLDDVGMLMDGCSTHCTADITDSLGNVITRNVVASAISLLEVGIKAVKQ